RSSPARRLTIWQVQISDPRLSKSARAPSSSILQSRVPKARPIFTARWHSQGLPNVVGPVGIRLLPILQIRCWFRQPQKAAAVPRNESAGIVLILVHAAEPANAYALNRALWRGPDRLSRCRPVWRARQRLPRKRRPADRSREHRRRPVGG